MISTAHLAQLCRRLATSLHAGLDARQVWDREAKIGPVGQRGRMADIVQRIDDGQTIGDALEAQHGFFPPLTVEMVHVGEHTGKLERVFAQLADHYENLIRLRRTFLTGLAWPAIQLMVTLAIIGLLIWFMGAFDVQTLNGKPVDFIGIGLKGTSGLIIYALLLALFFSGAAFFVFALSRGWFWTGALMPVLLKIPVLGQCLKLLAMSRIAWCLAMAIDAGMDAVSSIRLALKASQNVYYSSLASRVENTMLKRLPMNEALRETGHFPEEFLLSLETGELSGMVTETLERYADDCRDRAQVLLKTLTVMAGMGCALLVAALIVYLIFRMAMIYMGNIYDALEMVK